MKGKTKVMLTFAFLVVLIAALYYFTGWFSLTTGYFVDEENDADLIKCLINKNVKMYGSPGCPPCERQKKEFGGYSFTSVPYVDCSNQPKMCSDLKGLPAWEIHGKVYYGIKTADELRMLAVCE